MNYRPPTIYSKYFHNGILIELWVFWNIAHTEMSLALACGHLIWPSGHLIWHSTGLDWPLKSKIPISNKSQLKCIKIWIRRATYDFFVLSHLSLVWVTCCCLSLAWIGYQWKLMISLVANSAPQLPGGLITHLVRVEFVLISFSLLIL